MTGNGNSRSPLGHTSLKKLLPFDFLNDTASLDYIIPFIIVKVVVMKCLVVSVNEESNDVLLRGMMST